MKILHTSDWHLGKSLESYSRLDEQAEFLEELVSIIEEENVDLVLISGDIYDTSNPPADAENLFYKTLNKITKNKNTLVIIIAGNHDSPKRLSTINPLGLSQGIIIIGTPITQIKKQKLEHYEIVNSGAGFLEIEFKNEKAIIITLAYPSEQRINEFIYNSNSEMQQSYSERMNNIIIELSENYRTDTINLFMGHFFVIGGISENSERDITLGGNFAVSSNILPKKADYIAMGHLHRPQIVAKSPIKNAFYSGSPIQYDKSEILHPKCVYISEIKAGEEPITKKIYLRNYKPIEIWKFEDIEEAIKKCHDEKDTNCYVYLEIKTNRPLLQSEIKEMRETKKDIIEILPILPNLSEEKSFNEEEADKSIEEQFIDFYFSKNNCTPSDDLVSLFLSMIN